MKQKTNIMRWKLTISSSLEELISKFLSLKAIKWTKTSKVDIICLKKRIKLFPKRLNKCTTLNLNFNNKKEKRKNKKESTGETVNSIYLRWPMNSILILLHLIWLRLELEMKIIKISMYLTLGIQIHCRKITTIEL